MNTYQYKTNLVKNGEWQPNHSQAMVKEKGKSIEPTTKQAKYMDDLYNFCKQKGVIKEGFRLGRTKSGITSSINALITILNKNGLAEEFFGGRKDNG